VSIVPRATVRRPYITT